MVPGEVSPMRSVIAPTNKGIEGRRSARRAGVFAWTWRNPPRQESSRKMEWNAPGTGPGTHFGGNRNRRRRQRSSVGPMHWNEHGKAPEVAISQIDGYCQCHPRPNRAFGPERSHIWQIDASRPIGERGSPLAAMRGRCVLAGLPESGALPVEAVGREPRGRSHGCSTAGHDRKFRTLQMGACTSAARMSTTDSLEQSSWLEKWPFAGPSA